MSKSIKPCSFDGCIHPATGNGLCKAHNTQLYRGQQLRPLRPRRKSRPARNMSLHELADWILDQCERTKGGCLEWHGLAKRGYGRILHEGKAQQTHRLVLAAKKGEPIDPSMQARHHCDNPPCCNPDHLDWGTHEENTMDAVLRRREDSCGMKLTADNVRSIRLRLEAGETQASIAASYGVTRSTIGSIKRRTTWSRIV